MNGRLVTAGLLVLGAVLIVAAARGTLWFDELLSLQWARSAQHPWQLLELYRHDNNHPLNTLWLMLVGEDRPPMAYRVLSIASGIATLVLVWMAAWRISAKFAWVPLLLAATSFPLVLYAGEARGYAPALACLLGAWLVVSTRTESGLAWRVPFFWLLCLGAIFSHGTSLVILAALGLPLVVAAAFWFFYLRPMIIAGGPEYTLPVVLAHFFGYALGLPGAGGGHLVLGVGGLLITAAALVFGRFPDLATRVFFVGAVFVFPALSLAATDTTYLYFRYFLVSLPFLYLLGAPLAAQIAGLSRGWRVVGSVALAVVVLGQAPRLAQLLVLGRGDYLTALRVVAEDSSPVKTMVANNEMQVGFVLGHYKKSHPELGPLVLVPQRQAADQTAEWIVYLTQDDPPASPQPAIVLHGSSYRFVSMHRSAPVSGAHWALYRRLGFDQISPTPTGGEPKEQGETTVRDGE